MIEVTTHASYSSHRRIDSAECDTPEEAVVAARTLLIEARDSGHGSPRASFHVNGKLVRAGINLSELHHHLTVINQATKES